MLQLIVYVPIEQLEPVKIALFAAGAGRLGHYEHCAWQVLGSGQFKPLSGSKPYFGREGEISTIEEYRVEMIVPEACIDDVIAALKHAHPYETPAYHVLQCLDY